MKSTLLLCYAISHIGAASMTCNGVAVCGVLTLESGIITLITLIILITPITLITIITLDNLCVELPSAFYILATTYMPSIYSFYILPTIY